MGGGQATFLAFGVAALTIVILFFVLATAIATAQEQFVDSLRAGVRQVKRWGGVILIAVGLWFLALTLWPNTFARIFPIMASDTAGKMQNAEGMGPRGMSDEFTTGELAPLVLGLYEGEELFFIHTEISDPDVAALLTEMMGPQVVVVTELANAPNDLVDELFVFTNGVSGTGPLGFQPDVFASVPGDADYRPLRAIQLVTWQPGTTPRLLGSAQAVREAMTVGEVMVESSGIVVNAPVLVWHGGNR